MTTFDLGLLPSWHLHLHCFPLDADDTTDKATQITLIGKAFARGVGEFSGKRNSCPDYFGQNDG